MIKPTNHNFVPVILTHFLVIIWKIINQSEEDQTKQKILKYISCSPDKMDPSMNNSLPLNKGITYELFLNDKLREVVRKPQEPSLKDNLVEEEKNGSEMKTESSKIQETQENSNEHILPQTISTNEFDFVMFRLIHFWRYFRIFKSDLIWNIIWPLHLTKINS